MNKEIKLSIIIPMFNCEQYIERCINSIIAEIEDTDELIIIDDGSTDSSLAVCKKYDDVSIRIFHNSNHGVSYSRNFGIERARGEYVTFVDADDYLLPGWRSSLEKGMLTRDDIVYFTSHERHRINNKKHLLCSILIHYKEINTSSCWGKLFRRNFLIYSNCTFSDKLIVGEDNLFNLKAAVCTKCFSILYSKDFYYYNIHDGSTTRSFTKRHLNNNITYIKMVEILLEDITELTQSEKKMIIESIYINSVFLSLYASYLYNANRDYNNIHDILCKKYSFINNEFINFERKYIYFLFIFNMNHMINIHFGIRNVIKHLDRRM